MIDKSIQEVYQDCRKVYDTFFSSLYDIESSYRDHWSDQIVLQLELKKEFDTKEFWEEVYNVWHTHFKTPVYSGMNIVGEDCGDKKHIVIMTQNDMIYKDYNVRDISDCITKARPVIEEYLRPFIRYNMRRMAGNDMWDLINAL